MLYDIQSYFTHVVHCIVCVLVQQLFKGGYYSRSAFVYFFGKPVDINNSRLRYVGAVQLGIGLWSQYTLPRRHDYLRVASDQGNMVLEES